MKSNPKQHKKVIEFVERHFPDAELRYRKNGMEYRMVCPFCDGGTFQEASFDLNVEKGACQCHRATCRWKGSIPWFVHKFLDVDYKRAEAIVSGDRATNLEELNADLGMLHRQLDMDFSTKVDSTEVENVEAWVDGSIPVVGSEMEASVRAWLEQERGYDPDGFLDRNPLYVPPQYGAMKNRVLFEVASEENRGYLAYAMSRSVQPKTLNPPGAILSRLLYNYTKVKKGKVLFICEGLFDAARILSWGFHATCIFGVNISKRQLRLIRDAECEEVCVCLDYGTEEASREVAKQVSEFMSYKLTSIIKIEREGADPDELTQSEFLSYYKKRRYVIANSEQRLRVKRAQLKKLTKSGTI